MTEMTEVRWHGRGGQGAVTAAKILAEAALGEGWHIQAFPEYGAERRGAPVRSFTRIDDDFIVIHCPIHTPSVVVVLDATLLGVKEIDITEGLPADGILLVNTVQSPVELRKKLNLRGRKLCTVDATQISIDCMGKDIPNTPMIGAIVKVAEILPLDSLIGTVRDKFSQKKLQGKVIEDNIEAIRRAYEEVKSHQESGGSVGSEGQPKASQTKEPGYKELPFRALILEPGNSMKYKTGGWRTFKPVHDKEKCTDCLLCWIFCPDGAIMVKDEKFLGFNLKHCKGCGICAEECPPKIKAITMVKEKK